VDATSADQYALQVHALRNGTHYLSMSTPATWDYLKTFVSRAASSTLSDFSEAGASGVSLTSGEKASNFKKRTKRAASGDGDTSGGSSRDNENETKPLTPEEQTQIRIEKGTYSNLRSLDEAMYLS
jgi:hypothetical protein